MDKWLDRGLNIVLLVVSIVSLWIAIAAYRDAHSSGEEQLNALQAARQAILTTSSQQQTLLAKSGAALEAQLTTSNEQTEITRRMLKATQREQTLLAHQLEMATSQTAVLQKQWERQNQHPSLMVLVGTNVLHPDSGLYLDIARPKTSRLLLALSVRNVGTAIARRPQVRADIEPPASLECLVYLNSVDNMENPCPVPSPELPDILPDEDQQTNQQHKSKTSDLNLFVSLAVPTNVHEFTVRYVISADNVSAAIYSLHIRFKA